MKKARDFILDAQIIEAARKLGGDDFTAGVRRALASYVKPAEKESIRANARLDDDEFASAKLAGDGNASKGVSRAIMQATKRKRK